MFDRLISFCLVCCVAVVVARGVWEKRQVAAVAARRGRRWKPLARVCSRVCLALLVGMGAAGCGIKTTVATACVGEGTMGSGVNQAQGSVQNQGIAGEIVASEALKSDNGAMLGRTGFLQ